MTITFIISSVNFTINFLEMLYNVSVTAGENEQIS